MDNSKSTIVVVNCKTPRDADSLGCMVNYVIWDKLGRGLFAVVYILRDEVIRFKCAFKALHSMLCGSTEKMEHVTENFRLVIKHIYQSIVEGREFFRHFQIYWQPIVLWCAQMNVVLSLMENVFTEIGDVNLQTIFDDKRNMACKDLLVHRVNLRKSYSKKFC